MKNLILVALTAITILSGCGGSSSSDTAQTNTTPNSGLIIENQVKSNTSYTHGAAAGARYKTN
ncbi:hypothetical protein [Sulfurimonas sp.]|uniref:hypothetical protein n=1 Tax=Sulfurimonas sp. TaxID=2022749 RepID=UPI0025CD0677|nr:hypothetical protein [Sulfurimonas sp.]MBT5934367.1 hypothetical protein [Sulfurimonas sp.]